MGPSLTVFPGESVLFIYVLSATPAAQIQESGRAVSVRMTPPVGLSFSVVKATLSTARALPWFSN